MGEADVLKFLLEKPKKFAGVSPFPPGGGSVGVVGGGGGAVSEVPWDFWFCLVQQC